LLSIIPKKISPNTLTITASTFIFAILIILLYVKNISQAWFIILFVIFFHLYTVFDCLDGLQARRKNLSSPLGEYIDHFLDVFDCSIIVYCVFFILNINNNIIIGITVWFQLLSFALVYVEQREKGVMYLEKFGPWEAHVITSLFVLSFLLPGIRTFWEKELIFLPNYYWVLLFAIVGNALTLTKIFSRLKYLPVDYARFVIAGTILLSTLLLLNTPITYLWITITLFVVYYINEVKSERLLKKKINNLDFIFVGLFLLLSLLTILNVRIDLIDQIYIVILLILAVNMLFNVYKIISGLRESHHLISTVEKSRTYS
jgi:phosphatidylglycerophosphate synthase